MTNTGGDPLWYARSQLRLGASGGWWRAHQRRMYQRCVFQRCMYQRRTHDRECACSHSTRHNSPHSHLSRLASQLHPTRCLPAVAYVRSSRAGRVRFSAYASQHWRHTAHPVSVAHPHATWAPWGCACGFAALCGERERLGRGSRSECHTVYQGSTNDTVFTLR